MKLISGIHPIRDSFCLWLWNLGKSKGFICNAYQAAVKSIGDDIKSKYLADKVVTVFTSVVRFVWLLGRNDAYDFLQGYFVFGMSLPHSVYFLFYFRS